MKIVMVQKDLTPLEQLGACDGYYECPIDPQGNRTGPMVGYAGRDDDGKQYVGDVYANFAKAERHPPVLDHFAHLLVGKVSDRGLFRDINKSTGFCGAPEGGKALACTLGLITEQQYIFPEKNVLAVATTDSREVAELVWKRHEPQSGEAWWIVEDVCNNFSTTEKMVKLIENKGATVLGILCFLNRSTSVEDEFSFRLNQTLPVVSVVRKIITQYRQHEPGIREEVERGNVIWKPKDEWHKLKDGVT